MNYFAHGRAFVDDPYFLAGTALPDWLSVVDRRARVRSRHADPFCAADEPRLAALARGIVRHINDDAWFHGTRAFAELSLDFCRQLRDALPADAGFRPHFVGHILVEILLDAALVADEPDRLTSYYVAIESLDTEFVAEAVEAMGGRRVNNLAEFIRLFARERFLADYADDVRLRWRLNQVMRRVGLPLLPPDIEPLLAAARPQVAARVSELLVA